jgi:hypothetical protein
MKIKNFTIIVTAVMLLSFITVSPAQAIVDPLSISLIGFAIIAALITTTEVIKHSDTDSVAHQSVPEQKKKDDLHASSNVQE